MKTMVEITIHLFRLQGEGGCFFFLY